MTNLTQTEKFAVTYRISNTSEWRVWGVYPTIEDARSARKAMPSVIPTSNPKIQGKVLGKDIRPAYEWEA